jgi:hypothetical protein
LLFALVVVAVIFLVFLFSSSSSSFCSHLLAPDLIDFKGFISSGNKKFKEFCKEYFGVIYT